MAQAPLSSLPLLHSNPGATAKLFLDFDGHFESAWGFFSNITTPAFSQDGDVTTFSTGELNSIYEIWARVAEDFAPFNLDVTTVDPGTPVDGVVAVIAIGGSFSDWYGTSAGGVAFIGGFYNAASNVGYVFENSLSSSTKNAAEAAAHEAGHLFGLSHQSTWNGTELVTEYNAGNGAWAPIMGVGYNDLRTTWHNGPTNAGPTDFQEDMAILASSNNGFGYKADDYGETIATASALPTIGLSINFSGLIGRANDLDVFSFTTTGGVVTFQLTGAQFGSNLDSVLELRNSSGGIILSDAPSNSLGASLTTSLGAGTYYLVARSIGDYGNAGQYTIIGSLPEFSTTVVQFSAGSFAANENVGITSIVNLSRSGDLSVISQVEVRVVGGTAIPGNDFDILAFPVTFTFEPTESNKTVPILLFSDSLIEGTQNIVLQVVSIFSSAIGAQSTANFNILDGDSATISFQSAGTTVGEDDATSTAITLVLSTAAGNTLENSASITVSATHGTAESPDYDEASFPKSAVFTAGQGNGGTQTVSFDPASDTLLEGDETVNLQIAFGILLSGSGQTNHVIRILDGAVVTLEDTPVAINLADDGLGTSQQTYRVMSPPGNGTLGGEPPVLTYAPTVNYNGPDSFTVMINEGLPDAREATISLDVIPVNDAPSITINGDLIVTDETPAQAVDDWATSMSGGPPEATDEVDQALMFLLSTDNLDLFVEQPAIDESGILTFTPAPNVHGTAVITLSVRDDGGTAAGGVDTTNPLTFNIIVNKARVWHNAAVGLDVTGDGYIVAEDALEVIDFLNAFSSQRVPTIVTIAAPYYDVVGDGTVAPNDALEVINYLNAFGPSKGESLSVQAMAPPSNEELLALLAFDAASSARRRR